MPRPCCSHGSAIHHHMISRPSTNAHTQAPSASVLHYLPANTPSYKNEGSRSLMKLSGSMDGSLLQSRLHPPSQKDGGTSYITLHPHGLHRDNFPPREWRQPFSDQSFSSHMRSSVSRDHDWPHLGCGLPMLIAGNAGFNPSLSMAHGHGLLLPPITVHCPG